MTTANNLRDNFGNIQLTPEAHNRILFHNLAACREQNKLRAEGKLPVYRHPTRSRSRNRA